MRSLSWLLVLGLGVSACVSIPDNSQTNDTHAVSGEACDTMGMTAPAADGCNTCSCGEDGWACTKKACPSPTEECSDGETKTADCNTCTCAGGSWACTDAACADPECTEGAVKDDGCNTCSCGEDGTWSCTEIACPLEPECEEGERKDADDGCNSCFCTERGTWACTLVHCGEPECAPAKELPADVACVAVIAYGQEPNSGLCCQYPSPCHVPDGYTAYNTLEECEGTCTPGAQKTADDGCNTCTCAEDGTWGGCTEIACPSGSGACGGWLGDTCTDEEYCAYEPEGLCGAADASSICMPRPTACTLEYAPVCGCDGMTYSNACAANSAGTGILSEGECAAP